MNNPVLIPIEIVSRDLIAKIHLAVNLASNGFDVILGEYKSIARLSNELRTPHILLWKRALFSFNKKQLKFKNAQIFLLDDECFVLESLPDYWNNISSRTESERFTGIFCPGDYSLSLADKHAPHLPVYNTGLPQFDLLHPSYAIPLFSAEAERLRRLHGRFILYNSRFGMVNNSINKEYFIDKLCRIYPINLVSNSPGSRPFWEGHYDYCAATLSAHKKLITKLSNEFPSINIIVRPHPSEPLDSWLNLTENTNVKCIQEGSVIPWIMASELVLHEGCTTAVESFILNKPVVSYQPINDSHYNLEIPDEFSNNCRTQDAAIQAIKDILMQSEGSQANSISRLPSTNLSKRRSYLTNIQYPSSASKVTQAISALCRINPGTQKLPLFLIYVVTLKYLLHYLWMLMTARSPANQKIISRNFPLTTYSKAKSYLDTLTKYTPDSASVQLSQLTPIIWKISACND